MPRLMSSSSQTTATCRACASSCRRIAAGFASSFANRRKVGKAVSASNGLGCPGDSGTRGSPSFATRRNQASSFTSVAANSWSCAAAANRDAPLRCARTAMAASSCQPSCRRNRRTCSFQRAANSGVSTATSSTAPDSLAKRFGPVSLRESSKRSSDAVFSRRPRARAARRAHRAPCLPNSKRRWFLRPTIPEPLPPQAALRPAPRAAPCPRAGT